MYLDNDTNGYYKINVNGLDIYEVNGVSNWAGALDGGLRGAVRGPYIGIYSNNEEGFPVTFKVAYSNIFIDAK